MRRPATQTGGSSTSRLPSRRRALARDAAPATAAASDPPIRQLGGRDPIRSRQTAGPVADPGRASSGASRPIASAARQPQDAGPGPERRGAGGRACRWTTGFSRLARRRRPRPRRRDRAVSDWVRPSRPRRARRSPAFSSPAGSAVSRLAGGPSVAAASTARPGRVGRGPHPGRRPGPGDEPDGGRRSAADDDPATNDRCEPGIGGRRTSAMPTAGGPTSPSPAPLPASQPARAACAPRGRPATRRRRARRRRKDREPGPTPPASRHRAARLLLRRRVDVEANDRPRRGGTPRRWIRRRTARLLGAAARGGRSSAGSRSVRPRPSSGVPQNTSLPRPPRVDPRPRPSCCPGLELVARVTGVAAGLRVGSEPSRSQRALPASQPDRRSSGDRRRRATHRP